MMEFEEEHEEEEEEEEEEDSELAITPTFRKSPHQPPSTTARYRECLKNHAVGMGGHAVDGCGEFMPAGADGTLDALRCAACNCHRNFHRKEFIFDNNNNNISTTSSSFNQQLTLYAPRPHAGPPHHHPHQIYQFYPYNRTTSGGGGGYHLQRPLALPSPTTASGGGKQQQRSSNHHGEEGVVVGGGENVNMSGGGTSGGSTMMLSGGSGCSGKKRFRTKFSQEQKDKMLCLAEKLGWKIQKQDEGVVQQFCHESGVKRHVLKVWMHNNKHTLGKKP